MKKYQKYGLIIVLLIITTCITIYIKNSLIEKTDDEIINIDELSQEFMDNYFKNYSKLIEQNNQENILIVTSMNEIANNYGAKAVVEAPNHQYFLQYEDNESRDKAYEKLKEDNSIISVNENDIHYLSEDNQKDNKEEDVTNSLFGEVHYNSWGISAMGLDSSIHEANELSLNDVTVAVLDTGCDVELLNSNFPDKLAGTYNIRSNSTDINDVNGHGTHVTGTIAEATPQNVKVFPIKITKFGLIFSTDVITAVNYIVENNIADVINMSFGATRYNSDEYTAIEGATKNNIIVVAAAGNESSSVEEYPAAFDNTLAISSVNSDLNISEFSNFGSYISFAAPGENIESINGNMSGTSMATPHAVAAVAMLKGLNVHLSFDQTIDILENYALDLGDPGWDMYYGHGLINFENFNFDDFTIVTDNDDAAELTGIEVVDQRVGVNYLNETNFMNFKIKFNYNNAYYYTKYLWEIADDIEILNYDPEYYGEQEVTIRYNDIETSFIYYNVDEVGWDYNPINETEAILTGVKRNVSNYHASANTNTSDDKIYKPQRVYVPEYIEGYKIVAIGSNTFSYSLDAVFLPETVTSINSSAFENTTARKVISQADKVAIGDNAFKNAYTLEVFSGKISSIGAGAFHNCHAIDNIELDNDISAIYDNTFFNSVNLENVNIPTSTTYIGSKAFNNTKIKNLHIPASATSIANNAFQNTIALETITVDSDNSVYDSRENCNALINTATNTIILGSGTTTVPNTVVKIGNSAFINNKVLENIVVPSSVTEIERMAFAGCDNLKTAYVDKSVITLETTAFYKLTEGIVYIVGPYDSVTATKLKLGQNNYKFIEPNQVLVNCPIKYKAFEQVKNPIITLNYVGEFSNIEESLTETITNNYEIIYPNGTDSFRYGDTYFTIKATNKYGIPVQKDVFVVIDKALPNYAVPTNITGKIGQELSQIALPDGFEWMNPSEIIENSGEQKYQAKYIPEDTDNYEIIENIEITIQVEQGREIINNTTDYETVYDGENHTINIDVDIEDYQVNYSLDGETYDLNEIPQFSEVGEHTIYYRISAVGYYVLESSNKVLIYGIEEIDSSIEIKNDILIVRNENSFINISNKIRTFAKGNYNEITHYDVNKVQLTEDIVKTSDIAVVNITDTTSYLYHIAIVGDVNGDGKISSADYVKIRKHIMEIETISKDYFIYAADVKSDNKITSADYVQIRKYIMNGGSL